MLSSQKVLTDAASASGGLLETRYIDRDGEPLPTVRPSSKISKVFATARSAAQAESIKEALQSLERSVVCSERFRQWITDLFYSLHTTASFPNQYRSPSCLSQSPTDTTPAIQMAFLLNSSEKVSHHRLPHQPLTFSLSQTPERRFR